MARYPVWWQADAWCEWTLLERDLEKKKQAKVYTSTQMAKSYVNFVWMCR